MTLEHVALIMLICVVVILFYCVIAIHDIPYEISKKRNHPHQDAIHVAGWISLFTLHVLWPFLWIWATLWREDRGWGFKAIEDDQKDLHKQVDILKEQVQQLHIQLARMEASSHASNSKQLGSKQSYSQQTTNESSQKGGIN